MKKPSLTICAIGYADSPHVAARTRCFAELGHKVYLITETRSANGIEGVTEIVPELPQHGPLAFVLRMLLRGLSRAGFKTDHLSRAIAFIALLRRCRPDVVHVHFAYSYYGWMAGMVGCRPLAVTVMGGDVLFDEQGTPTAEGKWLTLHLLRRADYITAKSDYLISVLERLGGLGNKAERIVWGISLRQFRRVEASAFAARLGIVAHRRVVLSPKILQPFYRIHLIVEAMALVVRAVPSALLLITEYAAEAEYRSRLDKRIKELGLEGHIRFCGRIAHADMPNYYSLAEMTVSVPSSDGLPQTLLEGMACETPSVLGRLPRYEEIVSHRSSAYFVDDDPASIAEGIMTLFQDPELRATMARNALTIVRQQGNLEENAARVERRFIQLSDGRSRSVWSGLQLWKALRAYGAFRRRKLDRASADHGGTAA
jgi:glycosyltransferase involved in cell wall biosynthesis